MKKNILLILILTLIFTIGCQTEKINNKETDNDAKEEVIITEKDTSENTLKVGSNIGDTPIDIITTNLEGNQVKLSDYKGQVIFLNFWATWCPPCQDEMPDFEKFYGENKDNNFTIFAINVGEELKDITPFLDNNGYTFPTYYDTKTNFERDYKITGIPTTLIISQDYKIITKRIGAISYKDMKQFYIDAKREE